MGLIQEFPKPYSYLIYQQGNLTKAKPGNTNLPWHSNPDSATVIQAAIDALPTGGIIIILNGTYTISATLNLNSYITIYGESYNTILQGTVDPLIQGTDILYFILDTLQLDGVDKSGNGLNLTGVWGATYQNTFVIDRLKVINCDVGVLLNSCFDARISNLEVTLSNYGLYLADGVVNVQFDWLDIRDCTDWGLYITSAGAAPEGLNFDKSLIYNCAGCLYMTDGAVINFDEVLFDYGAAAAFVDILGGNKITFDKCWFSSPDIDNGRVFITPFVRDVKAVHFQQCNFQANGYYGLLVQNDVGSGRRPEDIQVSNCRFSLNGGVGTGGDIFLYDCDRIRIVDTDLLTTTCDKNLQESGIPTDVWLIRNYFAMGVPGLALVAGINIMRDNKGFITQNSGTATILNGANTIIVPHGLAGTPTEVFVNGNHAEVESAYADTFGAVNFTIHKGGAGNVTANRDINYTAIYRP